MLGGGICWLPGAGERGACSSGSFGLGSGCGCCVFDTLGFLLLLFVYRSGVQLQAVNIGYPGTSLRQTASWIIPIETGKPVPDLEAPASLDADTVGSILKSEHVCLPTSRSERVAQGEAAMTSADSSALPPDQNCAARRLRDRHWVVILSALVLLVGSGVSILVLYATGAFATQIRAGPMLSPEGNPFTSPVDRYQTNVTPPPNTDWTVPSNTLGLYGGTLNNSSCDPRAMVAFLRVNPDKAAAWASVHGIAPANIPAYVADLTPLILHADTAVINHGFSNGKATTVYSVLRAGTAILVDKAGVPRTLCYCDNPLTVPEPPLTVRQQFIDRQLTYLRNGHLVYRPPSPMRVNDWQRVVARVSGTSAPPGLVAGFPGPGPVINRDVKVGSDLIADLTGPDFKIVRVGSDDGKRTLATGTFAEWQWDVQPSSSGQKILTLTLYVRLQEGGAPIEVKTFDEKIEVRVNPLYSVSQLAKNYWPALAAGGAGLAAIWRWLSRRHKGKPAS